MSVEPEAPALINRLNPAVTLCTTKSDSYKFYTVHRVHLSVLYGSVSKQRVLSYRTLTDFLNNRAGACLLRGTRCVFTCN
jgi:hypothetical protein